MAREGSPWTEHRLLESLEAVLAELESLRRRDPTPCSVAGSMFAEPLPGLREAAALFLDTNANDLESFESLAAIWASLEELVKSILGAPNLHVLPTYGASESTLTALYALRELHGPRGGAVIASKAAHASVYKACRILRLHCIEIPVDYELRMSVEDLDRVLEKRSDVVAVVATLGVTDNGVLDPLEDITKTARSHGVPVYVDAAFGGLVLAGLGKASLLATPGVVAATMDPHKLFAPAPSSLLVVYDEELWENTFFEAPYMPAGRQQSLLWTRTGASLVAAYAGLKTLGRDGLSKLSKHLMSLAAQFRQRLEETGIPTHSKPWTPVVAFSTGRRAEAVKAELEKRGVIVYPSRIPGVLRYIAKWCHTPSYVERLAETVTHATLA